MMAIKIYEPVYSHLISNATPIKLPVSLDLNIHVYTTCGLDSHCFSRRHLCVEVLIDLWIRKSHINESGFTPRNKCQTYHCPQALPRYPTNQSLAKVTKTSIVSVWLNSLDVRDFLNLATPDLDRPKQSPSREHVSLLSVLRFFPFIYWRGTCI